MEEWQIKATEMFYRYRQEVVEQSQPGGVKELALLATGKGLALSELLEAFGCKPEI